MSHICATLLVLCSAFSQPSTVYTEVSTHINEQDLFIHEVTMCAVEYNSMIEPYYRLPVTLVVAQSILESNWGKSRFAVEGNNLFGIKEYDKFEPHMHAKNSKTMVRKYFTKCESVHDYIDMLTTYEIYHSFQDELFSQWFLDEIDVYKLIDELEIYAEDINYRNKLKHIVNNLTQVR
jgi:uncharacterized FlgJ-related protein